MPLTPTSRLALVKPDPDPATGDFVDVTVINGNSDKIDNAVGAFPCTSGTRPTGGDRWHGRLIRETDTRRVYVWNATESVWDLVVDPVAEALLLASWTTYTPVWSASTTAPVLGTGTIAGRYRTQGKTGDFWAKLTWAADTSAAGTGIWRISLPFTPRADQLFQAFVNDSSAGARWTGIGRIIAASATGDNMRIVVQSNNGGISGAASPFTWATGDELIIQGSIELA